MYRSTLGLRVIKKKKKTYPDEVDREDKERGNHARPVHLIITMIK